MLIVVVVVIVIDHDDFANAGESEIFEGLCDDGSASHFGAPRDDAGRLEDTRAAVLAVSGSLAAVAIVLLLLLLLRHYLF